MPRFMVSGDVLVAFTHELDADDANDAERKVSQMRLRDFHNTSREHVNIDDIACLAITVYYSDGTETHYSSIEEAQTLVLKPVEGGELHRRLTGEPENVE